MTNRLELNWDVDGFIDEQRYYCSETPIDIENLPTPKAILAGGVRTYTDTAIEAGKTYYVAVSSVKGGIEKVSQEEEIFAGGDPHWDKVVALLHFDEDLTDETGKTWSARGSASLSDEQSVFGVKSLKTPNANSSITASHHTDFDFSDGDFTIEFWVYLISRTNYGVFISKRLTGSSHAPFLIQQGSGGIGTWFYASKMSGAWDVNITGSSLPLATWVHLAFVRNGNVFTGYINGNIAGSATVSGALLSNSNAVSVGADGDNAYGINGYIDELRITKGVARYIENFTVSSKPFPDH